MTALRHLAIVVAVSLLAAPAAHALTTYTFVDLGTLPDGSSSEGLAINASMRVTGVSQVTIYNGYHAYCRRSGDPLLDLGTLDGDDWWKTSRGFGINASGQVTGRSGGTADHHPFLWTDLNANFAKDAGEMTDLGTLGGNTGIGYGVNDSGHVAGYAYVAGDAAYRAFLWVDGDGDRTGDPGEMRDLGTLEVGGSFGIHSKAWALSNDDHVVGEAQIPNGSMRAFIWEDNTMTNLGAPIGANSSCARDLNEAADMVVGYSTGATSSATLWTESGGTWSKSLLPKLVTGSAVAYGLNDNGQIVGYSMSADPLGAHAVIWEGGAVTDLNDVIVNLPDNVIVVQARDINNYGVIVGSCSVPADGGSRYTHACILTPVQAPVPEPATLTLTAAVLVTLVWSRRRRRRR